MINFFEKKQFTILYKDEMQVHLFEKEFQKWFNAKKVNHQDVISITLIPITCKKPTKKVKSKEICYRDEYMRLFNTINIDFFLQLKYLSLFKFRYNSAHFIKPVKFHAKELEQTLKNIKKFVPTPTMKSKIPSVLPYSDCISNFLKNRFMTFSINHKLLSKTALKRHAYYLTKYQQDRRLIGLTTKDIDEILIQKNEHTNK